MEFVEMEDNPNYPPGGPSSTAGPPVEPTVEEGILRESGLEPFTASDFSGYGDWQIRPNPAVQSRWSCALPDCRRGLAMCSQHQAMTRAAGLRA
jgi:hypothetical protein